MIPNMYLINEIIIEKSKLMIDICQEFSLIRN